MNGSKLSTNKLSKSSNKSSNNSTPNHSQTILHEEHPQPLDEVSSYIMSLTEQEQKTLNIAKSHLGTSFNINKSIGFLDWKSKQL